MGPDLWELFEYGKEDDEIAAIIRLGHYAVLPKDVRVVTQFSEIITVRMQRRQIPAVSGAPEVASMIAGDSYLGPDVEYDSENEGEGLGGLPSDTMVASDERRPKDEKATGRGVVVGVVDWGFDFAHPDFRNPDGTTRIVALWDQRGGKLAESPKPYGYGVVHDRDAINKALQAKDPYGALHYHPADADIGIGCHGTHVLSIAAGSGGEGRPTGIAPEADLVLVHNAPFDELESGKLGDSVTVLEGIDFISRTAENRPWVVNLSMGRHGEQHDGSTLCEQGFDAALRAAPGRAICLSAGNYFNKRIHASGQLRPTQERSFVWEINDRPTDNELEVWYSWQDRFALSVKSPDGTIVANVNIGERAKLLVGGKEVGNVYHRAQEPNNLDNNIHIFLYKEAPPGPWEVKITGVDVIDGRFHAWIERNVGCPKCQSHFRTEDADPLSTTGTICNGRRTLAVGAYNAHDPELRVAPFSSMGPTRDGRLKPDIGASGTAVLAARSTPRAGRDAAPMQVRMQGTSMASPHVAGTLALMFEAAPRKLRIEETHNLLLESAERVSVPEDIPGRIGIGYLDTGAAVAAARKIGGAPIMKPLTVEVPAMPKAAVREQEVQVPQSESVEAAAEVEAQQEAEQESDSVETDASEREPLTFNTSPEHWFLTDQEIAAARGNVKTPRTLKTFTSHNLVKPLIDGEAMMSALHDDLQRVGKGDFFHLAAWRLDITTELQRASKPVAANRLDSLLHAAAGKDAIIRALIWGPNLLESLYSSSLTGENTAAAAFINGLKGGEGVLDSRFPDGTHGAHHQKAAIVQRDHEAVAYCGSIDIHSDTWDTPKHNNDSRRKVGSGGHPGRHEVHLCLRGPAVSDIENNFRDRWNEHEKPVSPPAPKPITAPMPPVAASPGKHHVQVLRTYACVGEPSQPNNHYRDFAPSGESTCLEGYLKAIRQAKNYIYIEDQYLVLDQVAQALKVALRTINQLIIVVPDTPDEDAKVVPMFNFHQAKFLSDVSSEHPDKVHIFEMVQPATGKPIFVHSKLMIVDDVYAVVGSPNINFRSMTHDSELSAAVIDGDIVDGVCRFARDLRLALWAEHLEVDKTSTSIQDPVAAVKVWKDKAATGKDRVRTHVTGADQNNAPANFGLKKIGWDTDIDPDGKCTASSGSKDTDTDADMDTETDTDTETDAEGGAGPCPDVPAPHRRLTIGAQDPAVREAQRKMNVFHASEIAAGRPGLDDCPLVPDCIFGQHTFNATRSFQRRVFPDQPKEWDGIIGPHTWAKLDLVQPAPAPPVTPPEPPAPPIPPPAPPGPLPLPPAIVFNTDPTHWFLDAGEINAARGNVEMNRTLSVFTAGNLVERLIDGEAMMRALHGDLVRTRRGDFFHFTAWRLNITQDLIPPATPSATSPTRFDNVVRAAALRGVVPNALIWKAVAAGFTPSSVSPMIRENTLARDFFNAVGGKGVIDGRYPVAGSHHQKTAIVLRDGEAVAYCGGIDVCPDRWDTPRHDSNPRRTPESPTFAGWHDVHVRMRGRAVLDIESNFRDRWNESEIPSLVPFEPRPAPITAPLPPVAASPGTHNVQVLRTFACIPAPSLLTPTNHYHDFAPRGETTCLAGYLKAISQAQNYIYIEDQYLVSEELARALNRALNTVNKLIILVPSETDGFPVAAFNFHQDRFLRIVGAGHAGKVHIYHPVQPTTPGRPIYVHAKVLIIDDVYAVVGTPNVNRRGYTHDTEIAAAVVDSDVVNGVCRFARDLRLALWGEHLNVPTGDPSIADPVTGVTEWERQATAATFRVRHHVVPMPQTEFPRVWDTASDPDGRCSTTSGLMTASESEGAAGMEGAELVELADMVVEANDTPRPSGELLQEMSMQTGLMLALTLPAIARSGAPTTVVVNTPAAPAEVFDTVSYAPGDRPGSYVEVLAMPSTVLNRDLEPGDLMIRRGDGNTAHLSIIASPELLDLEGLARAGLTPEINLPGFYVQVIETGTRPHSRADRFARRVTDADNVVLRDTMLLRICRKKDGSESEIESEAESEAADSAERVPDLDVPCAGAPIVLDRFGRDKSTLTAAHQAIIDDVARQIVASQTAPDPVHSVCIEGHTDNTGDRKYNVTLSRRRIDAVEKALRKAVAALDAAVESKLSVFPDPEGQDQPVAPNDTEDGRARNRRAVIRLNNRYKPEPPAPGPVTARTEVVRTPASATDAVETDAAETDAAETNGTDPVVVMVGRTREVVCTGSPLPVGNPAYVWSSSDTSVAEVWSADGSTQTHPSRAMVRGLKPGDVEIRTVYKSSTGSATSVFKMTVVSVELSLLDPPGPVIERPRANELIRPLQGTVAHRTVQVHLRPEALWAGRNVQWTLQPQAQRGTPAANLAATGGFAFNAANGNAPVSTAGLTQVRVNMPSLPLNRGFLRLAAVDFPNDVRVDVDFEVPGRVVLDAGHGGTANHATGVNSGVLEKTMTLDFAVLVRDALMAAREVKVSLTRDGDFDVGIHDRAEVAKCQHADTLVSIHFNADPHSAATRGTEVFVRALSNHNVNRAEDVALANRLLAGVAGAVTGGSARGVRDDTQTQPGSLGVLDDAHQGNTAAQHPVRSCLVEIEYLTNVAADTLLNGPGNGAPRARIAAAMADAIILDLLDRT